MTSQHFIARFLVTAIGTFLVAAQAQVLKDIFSTGYYGGIWRAQADGSSLTQLLPDRGQGIATTPTGGKIYWTNENVDQIRRANPDGSGAEAVITGQPAAEVALDLLAGKLYWTHYQGIHNGVYRSNLNGTGAEQVMAGVNAYGVVIDATAGKLYVADYSGGEIKRANLDGSNIETLFSTAAPLGLALDAANGKVYWSSFSGVYRSDLDGSSSEQIVSGVNARGLALDPYDQQIYWADFGGGYIGRADLDGANAQPNFLSVPGAAGVTLVFTPEPRSATIATALLVAFGVMARRRSAQKQEQNAPPLND
ncbi:MAG: DUF5050 domain-containing protein [Verrucomicrobiae bacterium]|nr:DUF5050 domain-containing protein [Verrucomicrobiae bacterium]MCP5515926.1 DUF5050 domain-containing protein [Verrucomicrobiales bacterium]